MRIYINGKSDLSLNKIDSIEMLLKDGRTVLVDWDETDISSKNGEFSLRGKGVYIDDEYPDCIGVLEGCKITEINLDEEAGGSFITIESLEFSQGDDSYFCETVPFTQN